MGLKLCEIWNEAVDDEGVSRNETGDNERGFFRNALRLTSWMVLYIKKAQLRFCYLEYEGSPGTHLGCATLTAPILIETRGMGSASERT